MPKYNRKIKPAYKKNTTLCAAIELLDEALGPLQVGAIREDLAERIRNLLGRVLEEE